MIDIEDSTLNGFYFKSMKDCVGEGVCEKCGEIVNVKSMKDVDNLNKHNCKANKD